MDLSNTGLSHGRLWFKSHMKPLVSVEFSLFYFVDLVWFRKRSWLILNRPFAFLVITRGGSKGKQQGNKHLLITAQCTHCDSIFTTAGEPLVIT